MAAHHITIKQMYVDLWSSILWKPGSLLYLRDSLTFSLHRARQHRKPGISLDKVLLLCLFNCLLFQISNRITLYKQSNMYKQSINKWYIYVAVNWASSVVCISIQYVYSVDNLRKFVCSLTGTSEYKENLTNSLLLAMCI